MHMHSLTYSPPLHLVFNAHELLRRLHMKWRRTHAILQLFGSSALVGRRCLVSLVVCLMHHLIINRRQHNTPISSVYERNYETAACHCCNQRCCVDITSVHLLLLFRLFVSLIFIALRLQKIFESFHLVRSSQLGVVDTERIAGRRGQIKWITK